MQVHVDLRSNRAALARFESNAASRYVFEDCGFAGVIYLEPYRPCQKTARLASFIEPAWNEDGAVEAYARRAGMLG